MRDLPPLTAWLTDPRPGRGVHLADDSGGWAYVPYPELAAAAHRAAAAMRSAGVRRGDVVCLLMPTGLPCLAALFGAWAAGATVSPLPPPSFQTDDAYVEHIVAILEQAAPALVVASGEFDALAARAMTRAGLPGRPWTPQEITDGVPVPGDPVPEDPVAPPQDAIAVLQFTSGSTGRPRGVRVSWQNLAANRALQSRLIGWRDGDGFASWLPLHHDMGLIGCCLFPVASQSDLWLMRPEQFIRDPARWLACFAPGRAAHSAAPSFAFAYAARRVRPRRLDELDLSGWRSVCVGAEAVDPAALSAFARFAAPAGFSPDAYVPSYGLAENTLAVSGATAPLLMLHPDWAALRMGREVVVEATARLGDRAVEPGSGWLVGHGFPQDGDGVAVRILDEDGAPVPAGRLGEIAVSGTSVAAGYHAGREGGPDSTRFVDGELRTADAGFLHDGQLFVLGRMGDSLKLRGRSVYVDDLDAKVAAVIGVDRDRAAVVALNDRGRAGVAVFVEAAPGPWTEKVTEMLRAELGPEPALTLVTGRRGLLKRTTSGKLRRRHMWQLLQEGALSGAVCRNP
ncbi:AMP-binding protein [Streptomyces sp. SPB162]|uniref:AMP-binding protein n=1 Tax=Streptomyces sp. SPB162 TaxID=2940560 RepID=UPI002405A84D|nr:AMP-binding protein [Streptomyces sp. SPB162]MDF9810931.1 fatty-acyl-CoA synthase [Streptomyces sp. SPB162]